MFKKLTIENFKSHKKTELNFHPGVNVIVGDPQSGKTNISRALLLLTSNKPLGADYLPHFLDGEGEAKIQLRLSEGSTVILRKRIGTTKTGERVVREASYSLGDQKFQGMNKEVPDTILSLLNLGELNLQRQFDSPYLILSSPGEVARAFNRITRLEKVDEWVRGFATTINSVNSEITLLSEQVKSTKAQLVKYENLKREKITFGRLVSTDNELTLLKKRHYSLDQQLQSLEEVESSIKKLEPFLEASSLLDQVGEIEKEIELDRSKRGLLQQVLDLEDYIKGQERVLVVEKDLDEMRGIEEELERDKGQNRLLSELIGLKKEEDFYQKSFQETLGIYAEELIRAGRCPTCFSVINEERMKGIIDELKREGGKGEKIE